MIEIQKVDGYSDIENRSQLASQTSPRTPAERAIHGIWKNILNCETIGVGDNFYSLGGDHELALQVASEIIEIFLLNESPASFLKFPTISEQTAYVEEIRSSTTKPGGIEIKAQQLADHYPLSFSQKRMWLFQELNPANSSLNVTMGIKMTGPLNLAALAGSLSEIIRRHESLRTIFKTINDDPIQVIIPELSVEIEKVDISSLSENDREIELARFLSVECQRPFNLSCPPLIRAFLFILCEDQFIFQIIFHHAIFDGSSTDIFLHELSLLYRSYKDGTLSPLADLPIQYKDYACWQQEMMQGGEFDRQEHYWKEKLTGSTQFLELPADFPRPSVQTYRGGKVDCVVPALTAKQLKRLSQLDGVTLYTTLLAAFQILLSLYSNQSDFLVGTPIAGRNQAKLAELIGVFINSLVIRADLSDNLPFHSFLKRVQNGVLDAFENQDIPFERVLNAVQPERSLSYSPLFQVMFNMLPSMGSHFELAGLSVELMMPLGDVTNFDLEVYCQDQNDSLKIIWVYNADLFENSTIQQLANHFQILLMSIVENPDQLIYTIPQQLKSKGPLEALSASPIPQTPGFIEFNQAEVDQTIGDRFDRQAALYPEAIAVKSKNFEWSYRDLQEKADQIKGSILTTCGAAEPQIALFFQHDAPMLAGILGVLKAGKTYIPLDPNLPLERLIYIINDAKASAIVTNDRNLTNALLINGSLPIINIDHLDPVDRSAVLNPLCSQDSPAYILYTSGSTGRPKGVIQNHHNVLAHIRNYTNNLRISANDKLTQLASYCSDAGVMDMFGALLNGAALYLYDVKEDGQQGIFAWLSDNKITIFHSTPTLFRYFMSCLTDDQILADTRLVVLGGEGVHRSDVESYKKHFLPGSFFVNGYGPTESTLALQCFINHETQLIRNNVPIGFPVRETEVFLLNKQRQRTEIFGEIAIKSEQLALGYWLQPELTQGAFISDPVDSRQKIYCTGDIGRRLPDGSFEFMGRRDYQVKIRGYRVELGEIEAVLNQITGIRQAVVIAFDEKQGEKRLVAFIEPRDGFNLNQESVRRFSKEKLPDYMVPADFILVNLLPRTATGKIDRLALPRPTPSRNGSDYSSGSPRTPVEESLVEVWKEVLNVEQLSIQDNFFSIGGHSLLATQIVSRIRIIFRIELPIKSLFEYPTIADLANQIESLLNHQHPAIIPAIQSKPDSKFLPLSFSQERLWFIHQLQPDSAAYHLNLAVRISGAVNIELLSESLEKIIQRHETLRTTFHLYDGKPSQTVHPDSRIHLEVIDLRNQPQAEHDPVTWNLIRQEVRQAFDLQSGPLMRCTVFSLADDEFILLIVMHHIISDAWSTGVLIKEIAEYYNAQMNGASANLVDLPIHYTDYAVWQRDSIQFGELGQQMLYWRKKLENVNVLELPTDFPRPANQTYEGATLKKSISEPLFDALKLFNRKNGVTLFMTLLAAFKVLLHRYTRQTDIAIGVPIANRQMLEIENLIGTFVNTLVLRTDLSGDITFKQLVERERDVALEAYAHQDLSFAKLVADLQPDRDLSYSPLFQVMFNVINVPMQPFKMTGLETEYLSIDRKSAQFDLTCTVIDLIDIHEIQFNFNDDLFKTGTISRMLNHFVTILEGVVDQPDQPISLIPLLTGDERRNLIEDWNNTAASYPRNKCVSQLFEEAAQRYPDTIAVTGDSLIAGSEKRLTYEELDRRSNQFAHYLRKMGVEPNVRVGISIQRNVEMLIGLLGILKAGGTYIPLDPYFPEDRISYMIQDSLAAVLITQHSIQDQLSKTFEHFKKVVCLDTDWAKLIEEEDSPLDPTAGPSNLAYILYTSGSTGKPKGVEIPHLALTNLLCSMQKEPGIDCHDVLLAITTLSFDIAGLELYLPLISGASIVLANHETAADGSLLLSKLRESGATIMQGTPATWRMLIYSGWKNTPHLKMLCGGEALTRDLADQLLEQGGALWNMYGPTETTIWSSICEIKPGDDPIKLGCPISNTQFYILDANLQLLPMGIPGELYIGGDGVALGYINREDLTKDRFRPNPFSPDGRIYKTGDIVRRNESGDLEFLGRVDSQVKMHGFRIELGEIETVLMANDKICQTTVVVNEDLLNEGRLVCFYTSNCTPPPSNTELNDFLKTKLPFYMVPSLFIPMDQFPLTPNGKVDRKELKKLQIEKYIASIDFEAPQTKIECELGEVWTALLGVEKVGRKDDFFALGGHSLLGVRLFTEIEKRFGVKLPLSILFQSSTLVALASIIQNYYESSRLFKDDHPLVSIQPKGTKPPFFCVHPIGGGVLGYYPLAQHLGEDQPFFGLEATPEDASLTRIEHLEEVAANYIAAIQKIQSSGPYYLGGYSYGGTVAYEMARQLLVQGHKIGLLAMLDNPAPKSGYQSPHLNKTFVVGFIRNVSYWLKDYLEVSKGERWGRLRRKFINAVLSKKDGKVDLGNFVDDVNLIPADYQELMRKQFQAYINYNPLPYDGVVTVFRTPRQPLVCSFDPNLEWDKLARGGVKIIRIPGSHHKILKEPFVQVLAYALKDALAASYDLFPDKNWY